MLKVHDDVKVPAVTKRGVVGILNHPALLGKIGRFVGADNWHKHLQVAASRDGSDEESS